MHLLWHTKGPVVGKVRAGICGKPAVRNAIMDDFPDLTLNVDCLMRRRLHDPLVDLERKEGLGRPFVDEFGYLAVDHGVDERCHVHTAQQRFDPE
jgi:hypothetical protein